MQRGLTVQQEGLARNQGLPAFEMHGSLLRPMLALRSSEMGCAGISGDAFWSAALALQMAYEASLRHDSPASQGSIGTKNRTEDNVEAEVLEGDHLLATSYRVIMQTRCWGLIELFTRVTERTTAGRRQEADSAGQLLDWDAYSRIIRAKSGELFGFAFAVGPLLAGDPKSYDYYLLGQRLGAFYQMYEDLLDCCPSANTGRKPFRSYRAGTWTWPMLALDMESFDLDSTTLRRQLFGQRGPNGRSAIREVFNGLTNEHVQLRQELAECLGEGSDPVAMIDNLLRRSVEEIGREELLMDQSSESQ